MDENATGMEVAACAERLASAAEQLERTLAGVQAQYEALNAKVDRIVAAIDERLEAGGAEEVGELRERIARLETERAELKAQSQAGMRKTLAPTVSLLLAKGGVEAGASVEEAVLEKALASLSVEQRIAVKAEMARAGLIG
jgi:hypothetical protein